MQAFHSRQSSMHCSCRSQLEYAPEFSASENKHATGRDWPSLLHIAPLQTFKFNGYKAPRALCPSLPSGLALAPAVVWPMLSLLPLIETTPCHRPGRRSTLQRPKALPWQEDRPIAGEQA